MRSSAESNWSGSGFALNLTSTFLGIVILIPACGGLLIACENGPRSAQARAASPPLLPAQLPLHATSAASTVCRPAGDGCNQTCCAVDPPTGAPSDICTTTTMYCIGGGMMALLPEPPLHVMPICNAGWKCWTKEAAPKTADGQVATVCECAGALPWGAKP